MRNTRNPRPTIADHRESSRVCNVSVTSLCIAPCEWPDAIPNATARCPKGVERTTVRVRKNPHGVREHGRLVDRPNDAVGIEHAGNRSARRHPAGKAPSLLVPNTPQRLHTCRWTCRLTSSYSRFFLDRFGFVAFFFALRRMLMSSSIRSSTGLRFLALRRIHTSESRRLSRACPFIFFFLVIFWSSLLITART
jgi:hypothetical protein